MEQAELGKIKITHLDPKIPEELDTIKIFYEGLKMYEEKIEGVSRRT
jgi:hypothetical protein